MAPKHCSSCGNTHEPPRGLHCKRETDVRLQSITDSLDSVTKALEGINARMDTMDKRIVDKEPSNDREREERADGDANGGNDPKEAASTIPSAAAATAAAKQRLKDLNLLDGSSSTDGDTEDEVTPHRKSKGKASGKLRTAEHVICRDMDWPHFYVHRNTAPAKWEDLTLAEFAYGYLSMLDMSKKTPSPLRRWLRSHFKDVMQDAMAHKWAYVRDLEAHIFNMFERGLLPYSMGPADEAKIMELRRTHLWNKPESRISSPEDKVAARAAQTPSPNAVACLAFQNFDCPRFDAHDGLDHICAFCLRTQKKAFPHPEANCRRKKFVAPKNGGPGGY